MSLIRFGRNTANASPAFNDLWLPVFGGEVIAAFDDYNVFSNLVMNKVISSGQVAKFPATWKIGSEVHEAGTELLGLQTELREYSITLDDRPIVSHFEVDDIDEAMSHFEVRSEFARQCARALAKRDDQNVVRLIVLASRTAQGNSTSFPGGGIDGNGGKITSSDFVIPTGTGTAASAAAVLAAIDRAIVYWEQIDVPLEDRYCIVSPTIFHQIRKLGTLTSASAGVMPLVGHRDIDSVNPQLPAAMKRQDWLVYQGVMIGRSNNIPLGNQTATATANYAGDYTKTCGVLFQRSCIGRAQLMGIGGESYRDVRRQSDFTVMKMLTGGGTLRPYCAIELALP